jgi:hypothetical protein
MADSLQATKLKKTKEKEKPPKKTTPNGNEF